MILCLLCIFNPVDILLDGHLVDGYLDCPYLWKCMYQNTLQNQTNPIKQGCEEYGFYNSTVLIEGFFGLTFAKLPFATIPFAA